MTNRLKVILGAWKLVFLLSLLTITFMYAMFQGGFVSWFLFYSFLPILLYAIVLAIYPIRSFRMNRTLNQEEYKKGEELVGIIDVARTIPFPLFYVVIEEILPERIRSLQCKDGVKGLLFPGFNRRFQLKYTLKDMPRGEHHFCTIRIKTGDLFGLVEKEVYFAIHDKVIVYPHYVDVSHRLQRKSFDNGMSVTKPTFIKDTSMAVGIRKYEPGDRLSWIDWKATARRNDLMTKEFQHVQNENMVVIMDRTKTELFEEIVTLTASIVHTALKKGRKLSFISVGNGDRTWLPIENDESHLQKIFYHLAITKDDATVPFSTIVKDEMFNRPNHGAVILITTTITMELVEND
jgi:uncharacterized protein (DUF58 family)